MPQGVLSGHRLLITDSGHVDQHLVAREHLLDDAAREASVAHGLPLLWCLDVDDAA